jgi:hypothetical protein
VYQLQHRFVDVEGYVRINRIRYYVAAADMWRGTIRLGKIRQQDWEHAT